MAASTSVVLNSHTSQTYTHCDACVTPAVRKTVAEMASTLHSQLLSPIKSNCLHRTKTSALHLDSLSWQRTLSSPNPLSVETAPATRGELIVIAVLKASCVQLTKAIPKKRYVVVHSYWKFF